MGVAHLANHGYVQNDLKPGNILLFAPEPGSENGRAVLADFGIALGEKQTALKRTSTASATCVFVVYCPFRVSRVIVA